MPGGTDARPRAALVVNIGARRARKQAAEARRFLRAAGVRLEAAYGVRDSSRLAATVRTALDRGCMLIILGGGDGSVSAVVAEIARRGAVLGLLPLGTANDFARSLCLPEDLRSACEVVARGKVVVVDVGMAGKNAFVNVVTMGLGAEVVKCLSHRLKRLLGPLAYPVATALAMRRYRPFAASITFPEGDHPPAQYDRLLQLAVGNGRYHGGGAVVAPEARIDDGMLDVYAIEVSTWRALVGVAWLLKSGRQVWREDVPYWRTRSIRLETRPAMPINVDGELVDLTPESFTVARGMLQVLVPADDPVGTTVSPAPVP